MRTVTKRDITKRVAQGLNLKIYDTSKYVDATFQALREILANANPEIRIEIRDFGIFEVKKTKAKPKARNPRTDEIIYVPARRKTHFKPGKLLRDVLIQPVEDK